MQVKKSFMKNVITGAAFLGSGGGGSIQAGKALLKECRGKSFTLIHKKEMDDSMLICSLADFGSISSFESGQKAALLSAFSAMKEIAESKYGKKISAIFPIETGGEFDSSVLVSSYTGIPLLDVDSAARAVPALNLLSLARSDSTDICASNEKSELIILKNCSVERAESLLGLISSDKNFASSSSISLYLSPYKKIKNQLIAGSYTRSAKYGKEIRKVKKEKRKVIIKKLKALNAHLLAEGQVIDIQSSISNSLDTMKISISGTDKNLYTILAVNENMILYSSNSNHPIMLAPHSIAYLKNDASPMTNSEIQLKDNILLFAIPAHKKLLKIQNNYSMFLQSMGYFGKKTFTFK